MPHHEILNLSTLNRRVCGVRYHIEACLVHERQAQREVEGDIADLNVMSDVFAYLSL